jgi:hypothetical protein
LQEPFSIRYRTIMVNSVKIYSMDFSFWFIEYRF